MRKKLGIFVENLGAWLSIIAAVSFFLFGFLYLLLGGDALDGTIEGDSYFVCGRHDCNEVWPIFYYLSLSLGVSLFSTGITAALLTLLGQRLSKDEDQHSKDT
jgi:hypothetical protein